MSKLRIILGVSIIIGSVVFGVSYYINTVGLVTILKCMGVGVLAMICEVIGLLIAFAEPRKKSCSK